MKNKKKAKKVKKIKVKAVFKAKIKKKKLFSKKAAANPRKKKILAAERFEEIREVVERLPDMPLPGAPKELPKDLAIQDSFAEPALMPEPEILAEPAPEAPRREARVKIDLRKNSPAGHSGASGKGVWLAVIATFAIIAGAWAATLKTTLSIPVPKSGFRDDLSALKEEWNTAADNVKDVLDGLNTKFEAAQAEEGVKPPEEVLKAVGARVIFEAAQAGSSTPEKP